MSRAVDDRAVAEINLVFHKAANVCLEFIDDVPDFHKFVIVGQAGFEAVDIFVEEAMDVVGFVAWKIPLGLVNSVLGRVIYPLLLLVSDPLLSFQGRGGVLVVVSCRVPVVVKELLVSKP